MSPHVTTALIFAVYIVLVVAMYRE